VTKKHKHNSHGFTVDNTKTCHLESQRLGFLFLGLQDSSRSSSILFFLISLLFSIIVKLFYRLYVSDGDEDGANNNGNTTNNNNLTFKRIKRKIKSTKKKRSERKLSLSPPGTRHHHLHLRSSSVSPTTSGSQHRRLSWPQPPVSEESGFIVFCFDREDGGFDVVKEGKQEKKETESSSEKSPRTVNRKVRCPKIKIVLKSFDLFSLKHSKLQSS